MLVYLIQNKVNGKVYIGVTSRALSKRWREHINAAKRGSRCFIHKAIRKYGADAFTISALCYEVTHKSLMLAEQTFIAKYRAQGFGLYNTTDGGEGTPGLQLTPEARANISAAQRRRKRKPLSQITRFKIALALKNRVVPQSEKDKMSLAHFGHKHSKETIDKMKATRKGHKFYGNQWL